MSTIQDFKNAPVGATATAPNGDIAIKTGRSAFEWAVFDSHGYHCDVNNSDEMGFYTLVPSAPTTAQEALDLAWELAHEVKEGQTIPGRERTIGRYEDGDYFLDTSLTGRVVTGSEQSHLRTLNRLPEPDPDWLEAPAVLATCRYSDVTREGVFTPSSVHEGRWVLAGTVGAMHWSDLADVTPLYPEGEKE